MYPNNSAPIVIFTYRRAIDKLIESLLRNELSGQSDLYIFSDGYKGDIDKNDVLEVRKYLNKISGFRTIAIKCSIENNGLANSVINGVTEILNKYEKVIVLEDDLIVSSNFLDYMNEALGFYEENEGIWSISGYTPELKCLKGYEQDVYLSPRASSWGWATWACRWKPIDWGVTDYASFIKDKESVERFNRGGNDLSVMLKMQMLGRIDSWAIRWCYNQFRYNAYTVYPAESKLINNGFDEKGTHNSTGEGRWKTMLSNKSIQLKSLEVDEFICRCFAQKYNLKLKTRIGYLLKEHGGYKLIKKIIRFRKRPL